MRNPNLFLPGLTACILLAGCAAHTDIANITSHSTAAAPTEQLQKANASGATGGVAAIPAACSAPALRPAIFRPEEKRILVYDGSPEYRNIPAETAFNEITLQVEPAHFQDETVPAEYKEVTETIEVERERSELYATPAEYRTLVREILLRAEHARWKQGCVSENSADCIEQVPAEYEKVTTQMVALPARTYQRRIPAKSVQIKRKILIKPGKGVGIPVPARYETIRRTHVTKPWRIETTQVPSRYTTLTVYRTLREGKVMTMPVVCDMASAAHIRQIQQQLQANGYNVPLSGTLDSMTRAAVLQFQQDNGLALGGITLETLRKLGLV